jgi:cell wall-associated NlpC family hydrolase
VEGLTPRAGVARRLVSLVAMASVLSACATRYEPPTPDTGARLLVQDSALAPGNGGALIAASALKPGDILLSSARTVQSVGIQLVTFAPVSHALVYLGDGQIAEAVGEGVRVQTVDAMLDEELMVVAFRDPQLTPAQAAQLRAWALSQVGVRYNMVGVLLSAPFVLDRRLCELPLLPGPVRDGCVRGFATVQLGASSDDRFFCSQFVLEAYRQAGAPLTDADPRWVSPADLLHMREGDVSSLAAGRPLRYIGHLKYMPPPVRDERSP